MKSEQTHEQEMAPTRELMSLQTLQTLLQNTSMKKTRGPCIAVRLLRPTGEVTFTEAFKTERRAEMRFSRLVEACKRDGWVGSRVQCLDLAGNVVHERRIVEAGG